MRLATLFALACATRALVAWRTVVPARDSEAYLWMAEHASRGEWAALFQTVFHPLFSLLVAPFIALGVEPIPAAQLVSCGLGACAVLPLHALTKRMFDERAAMFACLLYAVGIWFVRHPADCLSEGPFFFVVAVAGWLATRSQSRSTALAIGVCSGIGFGLRPEGLAIAILAVPWFLVRGQGRFAAIAACGAAATTLPWMLGWAEFGPGFTITPKASFNYDQGIGGQQGGLTHYVEHALAVPGIAFEAIGYVALPLACLGWWRARPHAWRGAATLLVGMFVLQCAIIPALRSNIRFLAGFGILLLPFAGYGAMTIWRSLRTRRTWVAFVLIAVTIGADVARLPLERRGDRRVLIDLGRHLGALLEPGETIATEMPRLAYFAGLAPIPPRRIHRAEILAQAERPNTQFVAVVVPRTGVVAEDLRPLGFEPLELPRDLASAADARHILMWVRTD